MKLSPKIQIGLLLLLVAILASVCLYFFLSCRASRIAAGQRLLSSDNGARKKILNTLQKTAVEQVVLAEKLKADNKITGAIAARDEKTLASIMDELGKQHLTEKSQSICFLDDKGVVIYNNAPSLAAGENIKNYSEGIKSAITAKTILKGICSDPKTGMISICTLMPCRTGFISCSQPLNNEYLTGLKNKMSRGNEKLKTAEIAVFSKSEYKFVAWSKTFPAQESFKFLGELEKSAPPANYPEVGFSKITGEPHIDNLLAPCPGFERYGSWWTDVTLTDIERKLTGILFIETPIETQN